MSYALVMMHQEAFDDDDDEPRAAATEPKATVLPSIIAASASTWPDSVRFEPKPALVISWF